ncbi:oligoribonuclease [Candidatus Saccharibacteria bacterium]|nr:oligoribonuclease [Candidatus Saccharibacteria bacterium]
MKRAKLLWIDLEMTGLDPEKDRILEVAAIATGWDLESIKTYEGIVKVDKNIIEERMVGEFWEKNANSYKTLVAQNANGKPIQDIETDLLHFLDDNFGDIVYLAGNSIHQDRKFIDREMPELAKRLHYRMLDVSAWKIYFENALDKKFIKPENHRALSDIEGSINELKYYLGMIKK